MSKRDEDDALNEAYQLELDQAEDNAFRNFNPDDYLARRGAQPPVEDELSYDRSAAQPPPRSARRRREEPVRPRYTRYGNNDLLSGEPLLRGAVYMGGCLVAVVASVLCAVNGLLLMWLLQR